MLKIRYHSKFKKDFKLMKKREYDINKSENIIKKLTIEEAVPAKNKDHELIGNYKEYRECRIEPDWLLIYKIENEILVLSLLRTGTHSDLF